jgi:SAM-dependent methyltransferase
VEADFVVGDARFLPFASDSFDAVFSYSVLQHFSKKDARTTLCEVRRILKAGGISLIQMPNALGVRSIYHLARRGFSEGQDFDVRYWTPSELLHAFASDIGPTSLDVDGFFGLGIQAADRDMLPLRMKAVVKSSGIAKKASSVFTPLKRLADSLYLESRRQS